MYYCLNKDELKQLIEYKAEGANVNDESLKTLIENAECWLDEVGGLTYLFSHVLDKRVRSGQDCAAFIETLYTLEDSMSFQIHECDYEFVDFMLRNLRDDSLTLEEELVELQSHLSRNEYGRVIRFRYERADSVL
jgi:hypothetical protein